MSGYFSRKYLRYRELLENRSESASAVIEDDVHCKSCGYNLRGLPRGRRCPECGADSLALEPGQMVTEGGVVRRPLIDAMATGSEANRARWRIGLTVAETCVLVAFLSGLVYYFGGIMGRPVEMEAVYVLFGGLTSVAWVIAVPMLLPHRLCEQWPWMHGARQYVLWTQLLWIVGYSLWSIRLFGGGGAGLVVVDHVARFVAGSGVIVLAVILRHVAEEAELDVAERRLNAAVYFLPITAVVAKVLGMFFPTTLATSTQEPTTLVLVIALLPATLSLGFWWLILALLAHGLDCLRRHVNWIGRHALEAGTRDQRLAERRAAIDRDVESTIRSPPVRPEGDIPLDS
jgi:hypothetical protein